jgi:hypothetical protein
MENSITISKIVYIGMIIITAITCEGAGIPILIIATIYGIIKNSNIKINIRIYKIVAMINGMLTLIAIAKLIDIQEKIKTTITIGIEEITMYAPIIIMCLTIMITQVILIIKTISKNDDMKILKEDKIDNGKPRITELEKIIEKYKEREKVAGEELIRHKEIIKEKDEKLKTAREYYIKMNKEIEELKKIIREQETNMKQEETIIYNRKIEEIKEILNDIIPEGTEQIIGSIGKERKIIRITANRNIDIKKLTKRIRVILHPDRTKETYRKMMTNLNNELIDILDKVIVV